MKAEIKESREAEFFRRTKNAQLWALAHDISNNGIDIFFDSKRLTKRGILRFAFQKDMRVGFIQKEPWGNFSLGTITKDGEVVLFSGVETPRLDHVLDTLSTQHPEGTHLFNSVEELWAAKDKYLLNKSK